MGTYTVGYGKVSSGIVIGDYEYYEEMYVYSGGTANRTTVNYGGRLCVYSGGTANSTTVNDWGNMLISSGGTANSTTVTNYGCLYVSSGGTASSTTVNDWGNMLISSGGTATNVSWTPCIGYVGWDPGAKVTFASAPTGVYLGYGGVMHPICQG